MPLPPNAITISGGCNCSAIRYRVHIPTIKERQLHPSSNLEDPVHLPFVCIDHCNDCRRATGALLGVVLCSPTKYVEMSLLRSSPNSSDISKVPDDERAWFPANELFPPGTKCRKDTYLSFYMSSKGRTRAFCGNCGTHMMYSAHPYPEPWPEMLDIWVGSVDQSDLEEDWLIPERHLWCDVGVKWIQKLGSEGSGGVPKHGTYLVNEVVKEQGRRKIRIQV